MILVEQINGDVDFLCVGDKADVSLFLVDAIESSDQYYVYRMWKMEQKGKVWFRTTKMDFSPDPGKLSYTNRLSEILENINAII
ncbi:MAG: hypothetical protein [Caudoviricetes sp.]|nr:MAG: hypothetical protein [Caudoviricetes sp.]